MVVLAEVIPSPAGAAAGAVAVASLAEVVVAAFGSKAVVGDPASAPRPQQTTSQVQASENPRTLRSIPQLPMASRAELIRRVRATEAIDQGRRSPGPSAATTLPPSTLSWATTGTNPEPAVMVGPPAPFPERS